VAVGPGSRRGGSPGYRSRHRFQDRSSAALLSTVRDRGVGRIGKLNNRTLHVFDLIRPVSIQLSRQFVAIDYRITIPSASGQTRHD
jgi:hypothetical protein